MPTPDLKLEAYRRILRESQQIEAAYDVEIAGKQFRVLPGVFSPRFFKSTAAFTCRFPFRKGDSFLEMGCGTGITSAMAALAGACRVLAVDINLRAVENTDVNARLHAVHPCVEVRESDLFAGIAPRETFDTIYWNLPSIRVAEDYLFSSMLERSLFDPGFRTTKRFLSEVGTYLVRSGRVIIGFGDIGYWDAFDALCRQTGWQVTVLSRERNGGDLPVDLILTELTRGPS